MDVAPRAGGLGAEKCSGTHAGKDEGALKANHAQAGLKSFRYPAHELGPAAFMAVGSCAVAQTLVPLA